MAARFFRTYPLTARLSAGTALVNAELGNGGTLTGLVYDDGAGVWATATGRLAVPESSAWVLLPFTSTELRLGVP